MESLSSSSGRGLDLNPLDGTLIQLTEKLSRDVNILDKFLAINEDLVDNIVAGGSDHRQITFGEAFNTVLNVNQHDSRGKIADFRTASLMIFHIFLDRKTWRDVVNENNMEVALKRSVRHSK